jgi:HK97 family phage major capsid protein
MKYVKVTQPAWAVFLTPTQQGKVTIPTDGVMAGDQVCELANTIAVLAEISIELVQDGKTVLSEAVLRAISEGHGRAVDYACFQGNGNDDPQNGTQTGIFVDNNIPAALAANGETNVGALTRDDFIAAVAAVAPSALTRAPRWFISPALLPKLLKLRDGQGPKYLLRTPAQTEGEWELVGFPITWSIQAPGNDVAGQKVAAFGAPEGYLVALQEKMEILASDASRFPAAVRQMRLANRGRVETRESTWLATLALAKQ